VEELRDKREMDDETKGVVQCTYHKGTCDERLSLLTRVVGNVISRRISLAKYCKEGLDGCRG
jgi:hypothetical protein